MKYAVNSRTRPGAGRMLGAALAVALMLIAPGAWAADGVLDATLINPKLNNYGGKVALQTDGKLVVSGNFTTAGTASASRKYLARFNADGTLDTTFADPNLNGLVNQLALQSDGKIVVGGYFTTAGSGNTSRKRLARFNTDGTLDATFADPNLDNYVSGVKIQSDGKILTNGQFTTAGAANSAYVRVARFNADGTLDTTFTNSNANNYVNVAGIQSNGKIIVGGQFTNIGGGAWGTVARLNADGSIDNTFINPNLGGYGAGTLVQDIKVLSNDKFLVTGYFTTVGAANTVRRYLARFNADGSVDTTFADTVLNHEGFFIALQDDGKIILPGMFTAVGGVSRKYLARFSADGVLDTTFADPNLSSWGGGAAIDASGKVWVVGNFSTAGTANVTYNGVARFNSSYLVTLTAPSSAAGRVTSASGGISCPGSCSEAIDAGSTITLTATPASGYTFTGWSGSCSGSSNPITITVTGSTNCTPTFERIVAPPPPPPPTFVATPTPTTVDTSSGQGASSTAAGSSGSGSTTTLIPSGGENPATGVITPAQSPNMSAGGSGQGAFSVASSFNNPSSLSFSVAPAESGTPIPSWLTFNPSTANFNYSVPLPDDLPVQPIDGTPTVTIGDATAAKGVANPRNWANKVYPLNVLVASIPVNLTATSGTTSYIQRINMDFYASRTPVAITAVSYSHTGRSGDGKSGKPAIDWNGGQILFESTAQNLYATSTDGFASIGRYHGPSGKRDILSQSAVPGGGVSGSAYGDSGTPAVGMDGTYGAFASKAINLSMSDARAVDGRSMPGRDAIWNGPTQIYRVALGYPRVAMTEAVTPAPQTASMTTAGVKADADAVKPSISADGNLVAFESAATNLGANAAGKSQIWVKNFTNGSLTLVSAKADGTAGNGDSRNVALSANGLWAVFDSTATNFVAGVSGRQVYLKNLTSGALTLVSGTNGAAGNAASSDPRIDARGTTVVFQTLAVNLASPANGKTQILRANLSTGALSVVSIGADGTAGNGDSDQSAISGDGRFVVFRSKATNLVAGYTGNGFNQIWIRNTDLGTTGLVSQTDAGTAGTGNTYDPAISGDGSQIAFGSDARDLVNGTPLPGQIHLAANPLPLVGKTAYWTPPSVTGNGWIVERFGSRAYIAALAYRSAAAGAGTYWVSGICRFTGNVCAGPLNEWSNVSGTPVPTQVGTATATFAADGASVSLASTFGTAAQNLTIYPIAGSNAVSYGGLPQTGWWYFPAVGQAASADQTSPRGLSGQTLNAGVFFDIDTQTPASGTASQNLLAVVLGYDEAGKPVWYTVSGTLSAINTVTADLSAPYGGPQLGQNTASAVAGQSSLGQAILGFKSNVYGTVTLPGVGSKVIARFPF